MTLVGSPASSRGRPDRRSCGGVVARRNDSVFAHHGTTKELAREILARGFTPSEREFDWLGFGVYFWEDSPARALMWAEQRYSSEAACVVDAEVSLEKCLNLGDPEGVAK